MPLASGTSLPTEISLPSGKKPTPDIALLKQTKAEYAKLHEPVAPFNDPASASPSDQPWIVTQLEVFAHKCLHYFLGARHVQYQEFD
jgi:hypothetical protein